MTDPLDLQAIERRARDRPGINDDRLRSDALALIALVREAKPAIEQAARLLRRWSGVRHQVSGKWTTEEQAVVNCTCDLDATLARVRDEEA